MAGRPRATLGAARFALGVMAETGFTLHRAGIAAITEERQGAAIDSYFARRHSAGSRSAAAYHSATSGKARTAAQ